MLAMGQVSVLIRMCTCCCHTEGMEVDGEESHGEDVGARVCFEEPLVVPKRESRISGV